MADENIDRGDDFTPTGADADPDAAPVKAAEKQAEVVLSDDDKALAQSLKPEAKPEAVETKPEGEAESETDKGETDKGKKHDTRMPLSRHKEILEKERAARAVVEAQLAQYQKGQQVADINAELTAAETKILALEAEYNQLITDGHVEKATAKMAEIRKLDREVAESKNDMKIAAATAQATEQARYNISLERIEEAYPQLNPDSEVFDAELLGDVADLKVTYQRKGLTPTAALQKAVKRLIPETSTTAQAAAVDVTPRVKSEDLAAATAAERKAAAVDKTLKAVAAQPANLSKVGLDSDKIDGGITAKNVIKMSFKDFSALPEEQLSRMRGDVL